MGWINYIASHPGGLAISKYVTQIETRAVSADIIKQIGERRLRVVVSDPAVDRVGDVIAPEGIQLDRYRTNPVVLYQHDATMPVGRASEVGVSNGRLEATLEFPPKGTSARADEVLGLLKTGVLSAFSIGFDAISFEPLPSGGRYYNAIELLEISVVAVPANPNAVVIERSHDNGRAQRLREVADRDPAVLARAALQRAADARHIDPNASPAHFCAAMRRQLEEQANRAFFAGR